MAVRTSVIERVRAICLALPEAVEKPFADHTTPAFRVRDKFFVTCGEDCTTVTAKVPRGAAGMLISSDPARFFPPKYLATKGWVGVRLDLAQPPDWDEVAELITESYCLIAPKRLADSVSEPAAGK